MDVRREVEIMGMIINYWWLDRFKSKACHVQCDMYILWRVQERGHKTRNLGNVNQRRYWRLDGKRFVQVLKVILSQRKWVQRQPIGLELGAC